MVIRVKRLEELLQMIEFGWPAVMVTTQSGRDHYIKWCEDHITHKFGIIGNKFFFEKEDDLMHFILRWSNNLMVPSNNGT